MREALKENQRLYWLGWLRAWGLPESWLHPILDCEGFTHCASSGTAMICAGGEWRRLE